MSERPTIYRTLDSLSGASGLKEKIEASSKSTNYGVINVTTNPNIKKPTNIVGEKEMPLKDISTIDRSKYRKVEIPKEEVEATELGGEPGYLEQRSNRQRKNIDKLFDAILNRKTDNSNKNNAIINSRSMKEKAPNQNESSNKVETLSKEDLAIRSAVYEQKAFWQTVLSKKFGDKQKDERNQRRLEEFKESPYIWMDTAIGNSINKERGELAATKDKKRIAELERKIKNNEANRNILRSAFEKNLPLKLDREFTKDEISFDKRNKINVANSVDDINRLLNLKNSKYEVAGVVQRQYGDYIVLNTDSGQVELDTKLAERIIKENKKFSMIEAGKIVRVRVGDDKNKPTTYVIKKIEDGKVFFDDLTHKTSGSMAVSAMKNFLFDSKTSFAIEDYKGKANKATANSAPVVKQEKAADAAPVATTTPEPLNTKSEYSTEVMMKIGELESELGFKINEPKILERYLKVSNEEAVKLLEEYKGIDSPLEDETQIEETETGEGARVEKVNEIMERIVKHLGDSRTRNEAYETERQKDLAEIKSYEDQIKELDILREELLKKEGKPEPAKEEPERQAEDAEQKVEVAKDEEPKKEELSERLALKHEIAQTKQQIKLKRKELYGLGMFSGKKKRELKRTIEQLSSNLKKLDIRDIALDVKDKPFMYFAAGKVTNVNVIESLHNKRTNLLDLRWADKNNFEGKTGKDERTGRDIVNFTGKNEGFIEFNALGFTMIIKNVKELTSVIDGTVNYKSSSANYKIVGPDGQVIANNIKGYTEARNIYMAESMGYQKLLEKEFENLNSNK